MQSDQSRGNINSNVIISLVVGILLLLPLAGVAVQNHLLPALNVFQTAQTDGNLLGEPKFVGMENYERLQEDAGFANSISYTLSIVISRIAVVSVIPLIFGIFAGMQSQSGRIINRTLLSVLCGFIVPIALTAMWQVYMGQMWGREPSPIFNGDTSLGSPEGAKSALNTLDSMITLAIALIIGGTSYMAAMRSQGKWLAVIAIWLVGVLLAIGSSFLVFDTPFILTRGGPGRSTSTLMMSIYDNGFVAFRFGYAAAIASLLIVGTVILGFLIWLIVVGFNLRASYIRHDNTPRQKSLWSLISIPLIIFAAYPIVSLVLWAYGLATSNEAFEQLTNTNNYIVGQIASSPITSICLIQIPITYLAALSLGFIRPLGKIGSNLLFLILFVITLIPMEALIFEWYMQGRTAGIIDTPEILGMPWLVNGFSLLVLKLFFDGTIEPYQNARDDGQSPLSAFLKTVILPTLPIAILIGAVLSFVSVQSMLWVHITQNSPENWTPQLSLIRLLSQGASNNTVILAAAYNMMNALLIPFVIFVAIIQIFVLDRVVIHAGWSSRKIKRDENTMVDGNFEVELIQAQS